MAKILVVEDNVDLAYGLRNNLEIEGHEVDTVVDGLAALERSVTGCYELVLLDLMIPGLSGLELLRRIRVAQVPVRILILSALGEEADRVRGLQLGADDYMTKPFAVLELLARVQACLRRPVAAAPSLAADAVAAAERYGTAVPQDGKSGLIRFGSCVLDRPAMQVIRDGRAVYLRPREFRLLLAFVQNPGRVLSRAELFRVVWGVDVELETRTLDAHVTQLRRKIGDDGRDPRHIHTIPRVGYRFVP